MKWHIYLFINLINPNLFAIAASNNKFVDCHKKETQDIVRIFSRLLNFLSASHTCRLDVIIKAKSFQGDALSFAMSESQIFRIVEVANRPNEVRILSTSRLDYERDRHSYDLVITATERGTGLSSTVQVCMTRRHVLPWPCSNLGTQAHRSPVKSLSKCQILQPYLTLLLSPLFPMETRELCG